jgi:hypothetical protein
VGIRVFAQPTALPRRVLIDTSQEVGGVDCCYADYLYPDGAHCGMHAIA